MAPFDSPDWSLVQSSRFSSKLFNLFGLSGYRKLFFNWVSGRDEGNYGHYGKHCYGKGGGSTHFLAQYSNRTQITRLVACVLAFPNYWAFNHVDKNLVLIGVFEDQIGESTKGTNPCNCLLIAMDPFSWQFCSTYPITQHKFKILQNSKKYSFFRRITG